MQASFECLIESQQKILELSTNEEEKKVAHQFMDKLIKDMLCTEWNKRGKYSVFTCITRGVGSQIIFNASPQFLEELFEVFSYVFTFWNSTNPI